MNWIYLLLAGCFEVGFTFCIGKARLVDAPVSYYWYGGFLVSLILGMGLLIKAIETIPLGTAYAIFTGIGAVGTVIMGILFFKEPVTFMRMFFIGTLVCSIIGLKFVSN